MIATIATSAYAPTSLAAVLARFRALRVMGGPCAGLVDGPLTAAGRVRIVPPVVLPGLQGIRVPAAGLGAVRSPAPTSAAIRGAIRNAQAMFGRNTTDTNDHSNESTSPQYLAVVDVPGTRVWSPPV
jgi:hypothetical protein